MPDDIVTSIQKMHQGMVTFTAEELLQIYETARSTDLEALRSAAQTLYPDRKDDRGLPPIAVWEGGGRAFPYGPHGDYCRLYHHQPPVPDAGDHGRRDPALLLIRASQKGKNFSLTSLSHHAILNKYSNVVIDRRLWSQFFILTS